MGQRHNVLDRAREALLPFVYPGRLLPQILGYTASDSMYTVNNLKALGLSFQESEKRQFEQLVHHSDKGSQYCSLDYMKALKKA